MGNDFFDGGFIWFGLVQFGLVWLMHRHGLLSCRPSVFVWSFSLSTFLRLYICECIHTLWVVCVCLNHWPQIDRILVEREGEGHNFRIASIRKSDHHNYQNQKKRRTLYDNVWLASWWHFVQNRLTKQNRRRRCLVIVSVIKIILVFFFELLNELCLPSGANDDHDDSDGVEFRLVPYSSGKRKEKKKMIVRDEFQFQNVYQNLFFLNIYKFSILV